MAWTEDRRENLIASFHARDQYVTLEGAFDKNAKLLALKADVVANVGAYSCFPTTCGVEPLMAMAEMPGPYDFRSLRMPGARRAHQHLHHGALSRRVAAGDHLHAGTADGQGGGRAFAIDPVDIRRRNLIDKFPYTSAMGLVYDEASYKETLEMAVKAIDVPAFRARQKQARAKGRHLGIGFATFSERTGYGSPAFAARGMEITPGWETVILTVDPSGFVEARIGSSPHGQGLRTTLAQIIADEIGVTPDVIKVVHGDTDRSPYGWGTFASRSLVISGGATLIAARKVRAKLIKIASHMLEAAPGDIVLENGTAKVAGTDRSVTIAKMAREAYTQTHRFKGEIEPGLTETGTYDPPGTFSNACHVAIVEVDVETGRVKVEKFLVAEDAGRIINPMIADGQVHGGIAQGIGNALLEEIIYDESGGILTANLADYMPPTAHEIPPIELHHIETPSTTSITKAKGLGEGGTIGAPAAVINAINDALSPFGVQIDEMPATPQRIRAALARKGGKGRMTEKNRHHADHQRPRPRHQGRAAPHAGGRDPRGLRADRHPYRLRARHLRRLHRDRRRRAGALLPDVRRAGGGQENPHRRRPGERRHAASDAAGLHGSPRPAMRLLHAGLSDAGGRRARARARHQRRRSARRAVVEPVPLHRLSEHHQGRARRRPKRCAGNDGPGQNSSAAPSRVWKTGRCCWAKAASPPTFRFPANGACAWCARRRARKNKIDRCHGRAQAARRARGVDRRRRRAYSADPVSPDRPQDAGAVPAAGAGAATSCAMSASRSRWCSRTINMSPKTPLIWSRLRDRATASNAARDRATGRLRA